MTRTTKQKAPRASEQERKERRRAANRRSAQKSRYKESVLLEELQRSVADLSKSNQKLKDENEFFRRDIVLLQGLLLQSKIQALPQSTMNQTKTSNSSPQKQTIFQTSAPMDSFLADTAQRSPSPVESYPVLALDPDRIFDPSEHTQTAAGCAASSNHSFLTSADTLFRATMASVTET